MLAHSPRPVSRRFDPVFEWLLAAVAVSGVGAAVEATLLATSPLTEGPRDTFEWVASLAVAFAGHALLWAVVAAVAAVALGSIGLSRPLRASLEWVRHAPADAAEDARSSAGIGVGATCVALLALTLAVLARYFLLRRAPSPSNATFLVVSSGAALIAHLLLFWIGRRLVAAYLRTRPGTSPTSRRRRNKALGVAAAVLTCVPLLVAWLFGNEWEAIRLRGVLTAAALFAALFVIRELVALRPPGRGARPTLAVILVIVVVGIMGGSRALDDRPHLVHALADRGALMPQILTVLQGPDRDDDGYRAYFGGGDCDDTDPLRNPAAVDLPDNGIDEDCDGVDLPGETTGALSSRSPLSPADAVGGDHPIPRAKNLVLITIDTLRADHLGCYGYGRDTAPNICAFASGAVRWDRAYAPSSLSPRSIPSMLSGRYPSELERGDGFWPWIHDENVMVAETLASAGIRTAAFIAHPYLRRGCHQGFDTFDHRWVPRDDVPRNERKLAELLTDTVTEYLRSHVDAADRFFLWAHYIDPHRRYDPPAEFERFGSDSVARYDGEIAYVDHHIGRLLREIEASPEADATAIIITSDHGEGLNDHEVLFHGRALWEELVRVPLVMKVPGVPAESAGRVVARRMGLIELPATILEVLEVDHPEEAPPLRGRSFAAELLPEIELPAVPVYLDLPRSPRNGDVTAFVTGDLKLHVVGGRLHRLFDLALDPGERNDLARTDPDRTRVTVDAMKRFRAGLHEIPARDSGHADPVIP